MRSKKQRLRLFIKRLDAAPAAISGEEAFALLSKLLNAVENEFSGVPSNTLMWESDGRMYPPQEDNRRRVEGRPSLSRYRNVAHQTFIGANGSIRIETVEGRVLLDKPGAGGKRAYELDAPLRAHLKEPSRSLRAKPPRGGS